MKKALSASMIMGVGLSLALVAAPEPASACGGFFCSQTQPVNQAAERIVFSQNANGTVTAAIQIMYEGPSEQFSWLLPISSVPMGDEIALASNLAFQRLQAATNPNYTLTTRVEGTCRQDDRNFGSSAGGSASAGPGGPTQGGTPDGGGVMVEASGILGAFEWTVISLDPELSEPADAAVAWLGLNGYDVPPGAPALLGPYLEDGMYLLALRLTKGSDVGSIRPIVLTYAGTKPSIPVKLTAVAANADMGVMAWVLSDSRAVPQNYLSLELNEARINWFNASTNYNDVVIAAADDAGGQGFVTEFAGTSSSLSQAVFSDGEEAQWSTFKATSFSSFAEVFDTAYFSFNQYDGFWDAVRESVTLPSGLVFQDFQSCPTCYSSQIELSPATFIAALEKSVIEPMRRIRDLLDAHPTTTRLYTTLSADEMTVDPLFTFNPELSEVSNQHNAERIIECRPSLYQSEAPWRIELPQGGVIRGSSAQVGTWPAELDSQPPNRRIVQAAESGAGKVLEDNSEPISASLAAYNDSLSLPNAGGGAGAGAGGNTTANQLSGSGGGCAFAPSSGGLGAFSLLAAGLMVWARARKRRTR